MTGRPSKRTPDVQKRLLDALRAGNTRQAACAYAGISDETFANWQKRFLDFLEAVRKAEADAETRMVAQIAKAASDGTWTAAAWWLERRRSGEYGRRDKIELKIDIEERVRGMARTLGLDEDEVLGEAQRILDSGHAPAR